jgi:hypothetical protein
MMELKQAAISESKLFQDDSVDPEGDERYCNFLSSFLEPGEACFEPNCFWYYPVVDTIDYIDITTDPKYPQDYEVKAFITIIVFWKHLIRKILPQNSKGLVIVFEYQYTNDTFTYQIDGPSARYLGIGDKHDPKYDKFKISRLLNDMLAYQTSTGDSKYYGLPLHTGHNKTYMVHIYPSDDMKSSKFWEFTSLETANNCTLTMFFFILLLGFTTSNPIIFALSAAAFILFPFVAFLVYERKISRQQEEILSTANRSHAIVSSLFPSNVRDQLYLNKDITNVANGGSAPTGSNATAFMGPPIAELYPETTVLFTDVVNFTKWSSGKLLQ